MFRTEICSFSGEMFKDVIQMGNFRKVGLALFAIPFFTLHFLQQMLNLLKMANDKTTILPLYDDFHLRWFRYIPKSRAQLRSLIIHLRRCSLLLQFFSLLSI